MATKQTGERKLQILQTIAEMLEQPKGEKITTAALAGRLQLSEAALYRHFASKAQMYEGLIEFIEQTVFGLINKIVTEEQDGLRQVEGVLALLLGFAQKNRGMTRVLIGDALVNEDERLQQRINQFLDRVETTLSNRCASPPRRAVWLRRPTSVRMPTCCCAMWSAAGSSSARAATSGCRWSSGRSSGRYCCCSSNKLGCGPQ